MPNSPFYLESSNWPGSSGFSTGSPFRSPYSYGWDPIRRQVVSNDPNSAGIDAYGRTKPIVFPSAAATGIGANPYANFNPGFTPVAMPGTGGTNPALLSAPTRPNDGYNPTAPVGQGFNPFFTVANVKSPDLQTQIQDLLGKFNDLKGLDPTSAIKNAMGEQDPAYKKYLEQESGAISQFYSGDVQRALDSLREQRKAAYATATDRALGQLSRLLATGQMAQGGAGTVGTGSYVQKQALDTAANLAAQAGLDNAAQARTDYNQVLQGQTALAGQRANLTTGDITRRLLPSQVGANWFNSLIQALGPVAGLQLQNSFYGLGGGRNGTSIPYTGAPVGGGGIPNSVPIPMPSPRPVSYGSPYANRAPGPVAPQVSYAYPGQVADPQYGYYGTGQTANTGNYNPYFVQPDAGRTYGPTTPDYSGLPAVGGIGAGGNYPVDLTDYWQSMGIGV